MHRDCLNTTRSPLAQPFSPRGRRAVSAAAARRPDKACACYQGTRWPSVVGARPSQPPPPSCLELEIVQASGVILGDQDAVDRLLLRQLARVLLEIGVGLLHRELGDL